MVMVPIQLGAFAFRRRHRAAQTDVEQEHLGIVLAERCVTLPVRAGRRARQTDVCEKVGRNQQLRLVRLLRQRAPLERPRLAVILVIQRRRRCRLVVIIVVEAQRRALNDLQRRRRWRLQTKRQLCQSFNEFCI